MPWETLCRNRSWRAGAVDLVVEAEDPQTTRRKTQLVKKASGRRTFASLLVPSGSILSGEKDVPVGHTNMHVYPADRGHVPMMSSELSVEVAVMDQETNRIRRGEQANSP